MGSPETCPLCHSDYPSVRNLAGNINDRYVCTHRWHDTPPAPADDTGGAEAMDDEAANIEQRIGALDKARPGYIARLVRGICGKPVAYICVECGALWRKVKIPSDTAESWNMVSAKGCAGCDNGPKPLFDALYREPVSPARPTNDATVEEAARAAFIAYHRDYYGPAKWDYEAEWIRRTSTPNDPVVARWERIARAALRGAEYDALVAKCDLFDEINAERTDLLRAKFLRPDFNAINALDAATARAEKAERERDDARAALDAQIATVLAAHLDAPTDDDRRGEDGEAVQAAGSSS